MQVPQMPRRPGSGLTRRHVLVAAAAFAISARPSIAAPAEARAFIDSLAKDALAIIQADVPVTQRQKRFRELFLKAFDVQSIGRFVLGRHWQRLSAEEREKYLDLFGDYVAAIYADQFSNYSGQNFRTLGARPSSDNESVVPAQIERQGPPIRMDFRVRDAGGAYRITDVAVENVSLIITKRDEFSSVVNNEGVGGVMRRMQAALDNIQRAGG